MKLAGTMQRRIERQVRLRSTRRTRRQLARLGVGADAAELYLEGVRTGDEDIDCGDAMAALLDTPEVHAVLEAEGRADDDDVRSALQWVIRDRQQSFAAGLADPPDQEMLDEAPPVAPDDRLTTTVARPPDRLLRSLVVAPSAPPLALAG